MREQHRGVRQLAQHARRRAARRRASRRATPHGSRRRRRAATALAYSARSARRCARDSRARAGRATTGAAAATAAPHQSSVYSARISIAVRRAARGPRAAIARRRATARVRCRRCRRACGPARATPASAGSVAVKIATVGVPIAAARCVRPVSTPTTTSRCRASDASSGSVCRGGTIALPVARARRSLRSRSASLPHGSSIANPACAKCASKPRQSLSGHSLSSRLVAWNASAYGPSGMAADAGGRREVPAGRTVDRVAERRCGHCPALVDEVLVAVDRVMHVVEPCRDRLAHVRAVEAVPRPARHARDDGALDLLLQVEDRVVAFAAQRAAKRGELAPRRRRERRAAPAAKRDRHDAADARVERDQRRRTLLPRPNRSPAPGACALDVGRPAPARARCRRATKAAPRASAAHSRRALRAARECASNSRLEPRRQHREPSARVHLPCACPTRFPCRSSSSPATRPHELAACLASAPFAAETVVVDSGSRDDTVAIAQRAGARVVEHAWRRLRAAEELRGRAGDARLGAVPRRRRARHAGARRRDPRAVRERRACRRSAYAMARRNRFLGRWLAHGEGYPGLERAPVRPPARALVRRPGAREGGRRRSGRRACAATCMHASAESIDAYIAKQNRYTTLQAAGDACARRTRERAAPRAVARRALPPLLRREARLPRRRRRLRAHRDRRVRELPQVRQAARARARRAKTSGSTMHVLVTGAAGFIGMHTAQRAARAAARA